MRICLAGQACARSPAGAAKRATDVATRRRRESGNITLSSDFIASSTLHAAPVPLTRAELVDIDALDTAQVDADRRRAVRSGALSIAFDTAGRAEAVMQCFLVELVVPQLRLTGFERELALGREGPHGAELGADR